jgi:hypothetical protein
VIISPLQQPVLFASKIGFANNLKTSRLLDLDIPPALLAAAEEAIE